MATTHKILDEITAGGTLIIKNGDFLVAPSNPAAGNIQTYKESDGAVPYGQNLFIVVGSGTVDANGVSPTNNVYPVKISNGAYVADTAKLPIITQVAGKVTFAGGRNSKQKDVYYRDGITTISGIAAGQELFALLKAFLSYASEQFASGVNQFEKGDCLHIAES